MFEMAEQLRYRSEIDPVLQFSIKSYGILKPVVYGELNGKMIIIDGTQRYRIGRELKVSIPVHSIGTVRECEAFTLHVIMNRNEPDVKSAQLRLGILKVAINWPLHPIGEIAAKLSMSQTEIIKIFKLECLTKFKEFRNIPFSNLYYLRKVSNPKKHIKDASSLEPCVFGPKILEKK